MEARPSRVPFVIAIAIATVLAACQSAAVPTGPATSPPAMIGEPSWFDVRSCVRHNVRMVSRGRPKLDPSAGTHSPRIAIRLPDRVRTQVARRAAEEGRSVSDVVRSAVTSWVGEPSSAERAELRRIARLTDLEREALFLASNANVQRLLERRAR
jgi:hypothetical protein